MKSIMEKGTFTMFMLKFTNIRFISLTPKAMKLIDSFFTFLS